MFQDMNVHHAPIPWNQLQSITVLGPELSKGYLSIVLSGNAHKHKHRLKVNNLSPLGFLMRSPVLKLAMVYSQRTWKRPQIQATVTNAL